MTSPQPAHNSHYQSTLRRAVYTIAEDKIIVDYVARHPNLKTTGVQIWKRMENENVSKSRLYLFIYLFYTYLQVSFSSKCSFCPAIRGNPSRITTSREFFLAFV